MAFVAVDKNGGEWIYSEKPIRREAYWISFDDMCKIPSGTIKKLIGRDLSWDDEPVELT